jgi:hypothetical protein
MTLTLQFTFSIEVDILVSMILNSIFSVVINGRDRISHEVKILFMNTQISEQRKRERENQNE